MYQDLSNYIVNLMTELKLVHKYSSMTHEVSEYILLVLARAQC